MLLLGASNKLFLTLLPPDHSIEGAEDYEDVSGVSELDPLCGNALFLQVSFFTTRLDNFLWIGAFALWAP